MTHKDMVNMLLLAGGEMIIGYSWCRMDFRIGSKEEVYLFWWGGREEVKLPDSYAGSNRYVINAASTFKTIESADTPKGAYDNLISILYA